MASLFSFLSVTVWYRGWARNAFFIVLLVLYNFFCRSYVVEQAGHFIEQNKFVGQNPYFGGILFLLFILETAAIVLGLKRLKYIQYENARQNLKFSGCISGINNFIFSLAILFHLLEAVFVQLVVVNSTNSQVLGAITVLIAFAREGYFLIAFFGIIYPDNGKIQDRKDLSNKQRDFVNVSLTITSIVFYSVTWEVLVSALSDNQQGFLPFSFFVFFFFAFVLYMPVRLYFTLEDYYSLKQLAERRKAFWTNMGVIVAVALSAVFHSL